MTDHPAVFLCLPCSDKWKLPKPYYTSAGTCESCGKKAQIRDIRIDALRPFKITRRVPK